MSEQTADYRMKRLREMAEDERSQHFSLSDRLAMQHALQRIEEQDEAIERLCAWIADQPCDCFDEYDEPKGVACDRCQILGRDGRTADNKEVREVIEHLRNTVNGR